MRTLEHSPVVKWVKRLTLYEATTFNSIPSNLIRILGSCVNLRYYIDHTVSLGFPLMSISSACIPPRLTSIDMQSPRLEDLYGIAAFQTLETFRARSLYDFRNPGNLLPTVSLPQLRFLEFDFMDPHGLEQQIINNWVSRWSLPKLISFIFGGQDAALAVHTHLPKLSILGLGGTPIPPPGHIVLAETVSFTRLVALHDFRSSSWANLGSFLPLRSVKRIEVTLSCCLVAPPWLIARSGRYVWLTLLRTSWMILARISALSAAAFKIFSRSAPTHKSPPLSPTWPPTFPQRMRLALILLSNHTSRNGRH